MIVELFAVTLTSVYRLRADGTSAPQVEKIRRRGSSEVQEGQIAPTGQFIGLTKQGIVVYMDDRKPEVDYASDRPHPPELVNTAYWVFKTSPVAALFLREVDALACLDAENLEESDLRFTAQTDEVLDEVGDDHPVFILSHDRGVAFPHAVGRKSVISAPPA